MCPSFAHAVPSVILTLHLFFSLKAKLKCHLLFHFYSLPTHALHSDPVALNGGEWCFSNKGLTTLSQSFVLFLTRGTVDMGPDSSLLWRIVL